MKRIFTLILLSVCTYSISWCQPVLAQWTFEGVTFSSTPATTPTLTAGSTTADAGVKAAGSSFSGSHASASTVWSNPSGNGTTKSMSSNNWAVNDYYQFQLSTTGYSGINLTWDQMGSGTGPGQWKISYSTDGSTFTDFTTYTLPNITSWNPSTANAGSVQTFDLSSATALNNAAMVYIRISVNGTTSVNGGTLASGGTGRVDNFTVSGFTIFPVNIISFNASLTNNKVNVAWSATNEVNLAGYSVERSVNGKDFMPISMVAAEGAVTTSKNYYFVDENPVAGVSYYRLKMNDKDGSFRYSTIATIKSSSIGVSVYPNPVRSSITIQHEAADKGAMIAVLDLSGKQVIAQNIEAGAVQTTINTAKLVPGAYMIVYNNNGQRVSKQFIKE